ncbi:hypothetical protein [Flavobacterium xinjiangense]|uniref:Uncharacterized protein n=1 Tax=Flavobacterium xinjiangense TaxID=178356 RepID=A0A1M7PTT3_9FLAO|nr:hypothetical protein [Flavobacterium xinjiangense]SHN20773.1 hypothetical protein SAMN05216269_12237 [Flavobacterium xinjiangense]
MLRNISWGNYIIVIVLLVASWYLFVGLRFYFAEIKDLATGKKKFPSRSFPQVQSNLEHLETLDGIPSSLNETQTDEAFQDVEDLVKKLKDLVEDALQRKFPKKEFMYYLSIVLNEFQTVKNSPFRSSICELIVSECDKLERIHLTQQEVDVLWDA